ncbi:MAG TPA: hypothetical protein VJ246_03385 [Patescibacteria group bacterium]|nr:hypothetical protein [Patescibacteria group bacterium]
MESLKGKMLFALAMAVDLQQQTLDSYDIFSGSTKHALTYQQFSWRLPDYSSHSVRSAVSQMQHDGLVVTAQREGRTLVRMTAAGRELLFASFPDSLIKKVRWDSSWRVVIFSGVRYAPDSSAAYKKLRNLLQAYRFAALERGVYLTPYPLPESLKKDLLGIKAMGMITVLETKRFLVGDEKEFCSQAWNLEQLSKGYAKLSKSITSLLTTVVSKKGLNESQKNVFYSISSNLQALIARDPGLPRQVLPLGFPNELCLKQYIELSVAMMYKENSSDIV